jgi:hypothetical protein
MKTRPSKKEFLTALWAALNCSTMPSTIDELMEVLEERIGINYTATWWNENAPQRQEALKIIRQYLL